MRARGARGQHRRQLGPRHVEHPRRCRSRAARSPPPIARPRQSAPTVGWIAASGESAKTGSRKPMTTSSTPGTWISPANSAPKPSTAIATAIGHDCSAMWWSAPGKPTSVSSSLSVGRVDRRPVVEVARVDQLLRLLAGLARQHPEDQAEGVDRGEAGADVAADRQSSVHPAARLGVGEDLVLGEEARGAGEGGQRQAADQNMHRGERASPSRSRSSGRCSGGSPSPR